MNLTKKSYLSKTSTMIGGKKRIVYTGLKGGRFYMKGGRKSYLKKTNKIIGGSSAPNSSAPKISNLINRLNIKQLKALSKHNNPSSKNQPLFGINNEIIKKILSNTGVYNFSNTELEIFKNITYDTLDVHIIQKNNNKGNNNKFLNNTNKFDSNPTSHNDLFEVGSYPYYDVYEQSNPCLRHFATRRGNLRDFAIINLNNYLRVNPNPTELEYVLFQYSVVKSSTLNSSKSKTKVKFRESMEGDSVIEAVKNGGVILNPANEAAPGGGVFNFHDMNAMEENLCRQSNLITQLLYAHQNITKGKSKSFRYLGISGYVNSQCAIITSSNFRFVKFGKGTSTGKTPNGRFNIFPGDFRKLTNELDIPVLSIASPDMKRQPFNLKTLSNYTEKMKIYWELAIKSTILYCKGKRIPSKLIAVMPGDFIKVSGTPHPEYARQGAQALKNVLLRLKPEIEIVFARKTNETDICKGVFR